MEYVPDRATVRTARNALQEGFTLVELMVVVAIIALLAAIIIPNYIHARAQAAVAESEANMKQIATALELYYSDKQTYPASGPVDPTLFGGATNPYLSTTPETAINNHAGYKYANVAGVDGGSLASYTIEDGGPYDPSTLTNLNDGPGSTKTLCTTCTQIWYDPQDGFYGQ